MTERQSMEELRNALRLFFLQFTALCVVSIAVACGISAALIHIGAASWFAQALPYVAAFAIMAYTWTFAARHLPESVLARYVTSMVFACTLFAGSVILNQPYTFLAAFLWAVGTFIYALRHQMDTLIVSTMEMLAHLWVTGGLIYGLFALFL